MKSTFSIGGRPIGGGAPVFFVAEAGVSHFGDMALARELVDLAADAGADALKTQLFDVEALIADCASDWKERLRPRNLTFEQALELKERCDAKGLLFMSTAHDETRIDWLRRLDVPAVKVGSGERNNPGFLEKLARLGKPIIVSTGMHSEGDVIEALAACQRGGCEEVALLHCVTSYPASDGDVNLRAMDRLSGIFEGPVGYSDHTADFLAVYAAVARGAAIIEKHITVLRDVANAQDWRVSAGPENLHQLIADVRRIEAMLGHGRKEPAPSELASARWATKSLVAARDLPAGHVLAESDLCAKRPGGGLAPSHLGDLIGRRLARPLSRDECIAAGDLS
jgi:N-acetylneuraminate synthase/N,N'-diacetyllegionaminate synthase